MKGIVIDCKTKQEEIVIDEKPLPVIPDIPKLPTIDLSKTEKMLKDFGYID